MARSAGHCLFQPQGGWKAEVENRFFQYPSIQTIFVEVIIVSIVFLLFL